MNRNINYILFFILIGCGSTFGQYGFQKVYDHHEIDTISILTDIYLLNDSIYFTAGGARNSNLGGHRFAQVDENGAIKSLARHDIENQTMIAYFSFIDIDTNFRGNLVNVFRSRKTDFSQRGHRLLEYNFKGDVIFDTLYETWASDSLRNFDLNNLIQIPSDSSYILALNYSDEKEGTPFGTRLLLESVKYTGEVLWSKNIGLNLQGQTGVRNIELNEQGEINLHYQENNNGSIHLGNLWTKQRFATLDVDGNILDEKVFQDGDRCTSWGGSYFDGDTIYLPYFDSRLYTDGPNIAYYEMKPVLAKIDPNMDIIWKKDLSDFWGYGLNEYYYSINQLRKLDDTTFIGAYYHIEDKFDSISNTSVLEEKIRILNFHANGGINWIRDHHYYPETIHSNPAYDIQYAIFDLEVMLDGGFVLGGESRNRNFTNAGNPGLFAYLLRTNCLGFLSPPETQFSYESNELEVNFQNNSMNAGSYTWDFGDGEYLNTGEEIDSIHHHYESEGTYEVTLIAHGCDNEADTAFLELTVEKEEEAEDSTSATNYFNIYPNPVKKGGLITVETGSHESGELHFFDGQGKLAKKVLVPQANSIYYLEHDFAAGMYVVILVEKDEVVQKKKLVIR